MEEQAITAVPAVTTDDFIADRQRFWVSFTRFTVVTTAFLVILLIAMRIFLV